MLATLRKNLSTSDFSFSQVTEVEKRERGKVFRSRSLIFEAEAVGRGREMNRLRLRNVSEVPFFLPRYIGKNSNQTCKNFSTDVPRTIIETEYFFDFVMVFSCAFYTTYLNYFQNFKRSHRIVH